MRKNPSPRSYHSTKRTGRVKGATKYWVCENVIDWLKEDANISAKELQRRLKDEHKVVVHYKRVYHSKDLALY